MLQTPLAVCVKRSLEVLPFKQSQTELPFMAVAVLVHTPDVTPQSVMETCTKGGKA